MPCHVAAHPSDSSVYFVQKARDEGLKLVEWIMDLGQKMEESTSIEGKEDDILFHIGLNPKLKMVQVSGLDNHVDDERAAYKINRAARAAAAYRRNSPASRTPPARRRAAE